VVVRNNLWDYLHGTPMKAVYEGYSCWDLLWQFGKTWTFKHYYNYIPTAFNFYIPRFLGFPAYKLKVMFERNYFTKIYQMKPNYSYPYLSKDRYFRPADENRFLKEHKISVKDVFPHEYKKPVLSYEEHGHGHEDQHKKIAAAPAH
jgi:hypothetical protein